MARKAVFLDRDGVINAYAYDPEFGTFDSPANPEQFTLLPGVAEAVARLNKEGFLTIVVSNQPGVAKGHFTPALLEAVTRKMKVLVEQGGGNLDGVYYCPHHPTDGQSPYVTTCDCRKPRTGLVDKAARELDIDIRTSYVVGDKWSDVELGQRAGAHSVLVETGFAPDDPGNKRPHNIADPEFTAHSLSEAADWIIQRVIAGMK